MSFPEANERPSGLHEPQPQAALQHSQIAAQPTAEPPPSNTPLPETHRGAAPETQRVHRTATTRGNNVRSVPVRPTQTITGPTVGKGNRIARQVQQSGGDSTTYATPTLEGSGRKSGRLREKGPTTYTTKGEVFRGGKRVNEGKYGNM